MTRFGDHTDDRHYISLFLGSRPITQKPLDRFYGKLDGKVADGPTKKPLDFNDNDNDKRLGLTAQADQPDHKKNTVYTKNKN